MNTLRVEKVMQLASIAGIWLAFAVVWFAVSGYMKIFGDRGADLPDPTLIWMALAQSGLMFVVPAVLTFVIAWLVKTGSRHAGWASIVVLGIGLLYVTGAHVAAVLPALPAFKLCGSV